MVIVWPAIFAFGVSISTMRFNIYIAEHLKQSHLFLLVDEGSVIVGKNEQKHYHQTGLQIQKISVKAMIDAHLKMSGMVHPNLIGEAVRVDAQTRHSGAHRVFRD